MSLRTLESGMSKVQMPQSNQGPRFRALTIAGGSGGSELGPGNLWQPKVIPGLIPVMPEFNGVSKEKVIEIFEDVAVATPGHKVELGPLRGNKPRAISPDDKMAKLHRYLLACLELEGVIIINPGQPAIGPNYKPTFRPTSTQSICEKVYYLGSLTLLGRVETGQWKIEAHIPFKTGS